MISKELLSEVLKINVISVEIEDNGIHICAYRDGVHTEFTCNIHELVHKCKEWAKKKEYWAISGYDEGYFCMLKDMPDNRWFYDNTEHEAIFKACEWVMEQIK